MEIFTLIFPVFAVIVTGYVVARIKLLPDDTAGALVQFVYYIAIPALLFVIIAQQDLKGLLNGAFITAFGGATAVVFLATFFGTRFLFKKDLAATTMIAMLCVASNTGIIGLPLLHALFGGKVTVLAALANIVVVAFMLIQVILLEATQTDDPKKQGSLFKHIRNALMNPVVLSTLLGIVYAVLPFGFPKIAADYLNILGAALAPCALFAVGMSIKPESIIKSGKLVVFACTVKLVVLPVLAFALTRLMGLDALVSVAVVVSAALPTAKTEFILAGQYHEEEDVTAQTVSASTALAVVTLIIWLVILSHTFPDAFTLT